MRQVRMAFIGSRETPREVCTEVTRMACELSVDPDRRYLLPNSHVRHLPMDLEFVGLSGGAQGFDEAAEAGFRYAGALNRFKCFLPYEGYRGNKSRYFGVCDKAIEICLRYHPAPHRLSGLTLKLLARDSYQILDETLDNPVDAVLCWTHDGNATGGTGQGLRIAADYPDIKIFNLQRKNALEKFHNWLWRLK